MTCLGDAPETLGRPRAATLRSGAMKDDQVRRVHERLAAAPGLRPVSFGEGRRFGLWDLASLTEGTLGACVDPDSLTVSIEKRLRAGAGGDDRRRYLHRYEVRESEGELVFVASPGNDSDSDLVPLLAAGDIGEPEGLAYKIRGFERVAREEGVTGGTPTPGMRCQSGGNSDARAVVHVIR